MTVPKSKIILKKKFLKTLPYINAWPKDQKFISKLIKKIYLNENDKKILSQYFDVTNKHWSNWDGESDFKIWVLFTTPEQCSIFDNKFIRRERIKIIPFMSKYAVGNLDNNIKQYANRDKEFNKLYRKRLSEETYYQRDYVCLTFFEKIAEKIRVKLYRNKRIREFINRYFYNYLVK
jgi:hypothetical protein